MLQQSFSNIPTLGDYGNVEYSLVGEQSSSFEIDGKTGEILVANPTILDRETLSEVVITAVATDQGLPKDARRSTTANVIIKVLDLNDNIPVFRQRVYHATVAENAALNPPATILQVIFAAIFHKICEHVIGIFSEIL